MCIFGGNSAPAAKPVAAPPAPTRASVSTDPLVQSALATAQNRLGVFGNIKTTPMGDATYGGSSVPIARFGAASQ